MAYGVSPGPAGETDEIMVIDDGTLVRAASPVPGPVGLQAKGGGVKSVNGSLGDSAAGFARGKIGQRVGGGECFDLADQALRNAGAKSAADFGQVVPDADYQWGTPVNLSELRTGDIVQFRDYRYDRTIETDTRTDTDFQERPHHTAIVDRVDGQGAVTVLEQNVPQSGSVRRSQLFFSDINSDNGGKKTTITVQGRFWFYRPQAR